MDRAQEFGACCVEDQQIVVFGYNEHVHGRLCYSEHLGAFGQSNLCRHWDHGGRLIEPDDKKNHDGYDAEDHCRREHGYQAPKEAQGSLAGRIEWINLIRAVFLGCFGYADQATCLFHRGEPARAPR